jgi:hypothetical protein
MLQPLPKWGLIAGFIFLAIAVLDGIRVPEQFFRSYLLAFVFWIGLPLGSAAFLMMHYLTGGRWGLPLKRPLETAPALLPAFAVLVIPLFFGLHQIFPWAQHSAAQDPHFQEKSFYLNIPFFIGRQILYFVVWGWLAFRLQRLSQQVSANNDRAILARVENLSAGGLILYVLTTTFFSIDWVMSLESQWFSTVFGLIFIASQAQIGLCFAILAAWKKGDSRTYLLDHPADTFNDIGNLQLTWVMLWAYLAFSQFLIIWSGNLSSEVSWYLSRLSAAWGVIALLLIISYFAAPFVILLMRDFKRQLRSLAIISAWLIIANFVYVFWIVVPSFLPQPRFYLLDFLLVAGIGCITVTLFLREMQKAPLPSPADLG